MACCRSSQFSTTKSFLEDHNLSLVVVTVLVPACMLSSATKAFSVAFLKARFRTRAAPDYPQLRSDKGMWDLTPSASGRTFLNSIGSIRVSLPLPESFRSAGFAHEIVDSIYTVLAVQDEFFQRVPSTVPRPAGLPRARRLYVTLELSNQ